MTKNIVTKALALSPNVQMMSNEVNCVWVSFHESFRRKISWHFKLNHDDIVHCWQRYVAEVLSRLHGGFCGLRPQTKFNAHSNGNTKPWESVEFFILSICILFYPVIYGQSSTCGCYPGPNPVDTGGLLGV